MDWEAIQQAFELVKKERVKRIDGDGWTVYRVGYIIRIDIKEEASRLLFAGITQDKLGFS